MKKAPLPPHDYLQEWDEQIKRLQEENARLRAALIIADEAINPKDSIRLKVRTVRERLKRATGIIHEALRD